MARPRKRNLHLPKYVTENHGSYWYKSPGQKAKRVADVGDERTLYQFMADSHKPVGPIATMGDLFDRYEREIVPTLAPRTQKDYHRHLKVLRAVFGRMGPNEVTPKDVGMFLDVTKGKIHRVRMVAVLSAVYGYAVGAWYVADRNPCRDVKRPKTSKRNRYVTDEEFNAVRALMPPRMRVAMDLALLTGQRQGDLLSLTWDNVREDGLFFQQGKTGKRLLIARSVALDEVLERAKQMIPQVPRTFVIRREDGKPYSSYGFRAIWQRYMKRAVEGYTRYRQTYPAVIQSRFTFHDLRAKNISDSASIQDAFERAGHTSMAMTRGTYDRGVRKVTPLK